MSGNGANALASNISKLAFSRRSSASFTALANGLLAIAVCSILPARAFSFVCLPLIVLATWPLWQDGAFRIRPTDAVFVPDPLYIDFSELAKAIANAVDSLDGERYSIIACPVADERGCAVPYKIAFTGRCVAISTCNGNKVMRKTASTIRPKTPLPVLVDSTPVKMTFEKARRKGDVVLRTNVLSKPRRGFVATDAVKIAAAAIVIAKTTLAWTSGW